ncbi:uncharacterized protein AB675_7022 [Cyphellophora attinorum]|uniref:Uncharacterized protein n=1 Tax=Cyphellophora attinorum TaxID=1664694 RepID=A0A0N0NQ96_9EURO|nr:uncharacterized protein AB675_7022 [Phialophora attinorum]KPI43651.1 hypothetical protein AB675_7022 [Phialophora attinorum]
MPRRLSPAVSEESKPEMDAKTIAEAKEDVVHKKAASPSVSDLAKCCLRYYGLGLKLLRDNTLHPDKCFQSLIRFTKKTSDDERKDIVTTTIFVNALLPAPIAPKQLIAARDAYPMNPVFIGMVRGRLRIWEYEWWQDEAIGLPQLSKVFAKGGRKEFTAIHEDAKAKLVSLLDDIVVGVTPDNNDKDAEDDAGADSRRVSDSSDAQAAYDLAEDSDSEGTIF